MYVNIIHQRTNQPLKLSIVSFVPEDTLTGTLMDLFGAGSETVRTSILWCIYTMAAYPEVQARVQKEMVEVLGPDKRPEFLDQRRLPYTHAVILEVTRWKSIIALNIMR